MHHETDPAKIDRLNAARETFQAEMAEAIQEQIKTFTKLTEKVGLPDPASLNSPGPGETKRIYWSDEEAEAITRTAAKVFPLYLADTGEKLDEFTPRQKLSMLLRLIRSVANRILPAHRHRELPGISALPASHKEELCAIVEFPLNHEEAPAAPIAPEPPKTVIWTRQEEDALLIHLCHLMRRQGLRHIPETEDRVGSMMFADFIREAQERACARHRRRNLNFARGALLDAGLMPRLEPMLKLPQLPPLPDAPLEIEDLVTQPLPKPAERNGMYPVAVPEPVAAAPVREPAKAPVSLPGNSLAELIQASAARLIEAVGQIEAMERKVSEVAALNDELMKEDQTMRDRLAGTEKRLLELEEQVRELSQADRKHVPRVAIVGCRKDEFDQVTKLAGENGLHLVFKHYDQDSKVQRVFGDYAVMMKWVSHAWEDQIKASGIPRDQFAFVTGGAGKVVAQLAVWFAPEHANA